MEISEERLREIIREEIQKAHQPIWAVSPTPVRDPQCVCPQTRNGETIGWGGYCPVHSVRMTS